MTWCAPLNNEYYHFLLSWKQMLINERAYIYKKQIIVNYKGENTHTHNHVKVELKPNT